MKLHSLLAALALCACSITASAQTLLWHQTELSWTASTTCTDGSPASNCPITGWIVETAVAPTGAAWTQLSTETASTLQRVYSNLVAGPHCYRVIARSAAGNSVPGAVVCKTNTPPLPNPPTLVVIEPQAMSVRADWDRLAFVPYNAVGTVPVGTRCDDTKPLGDGWYAVSLDAVTWTGRNRPANVVARCGHGG